MRALYPQRDIKLVAGLLLGRFQETEDAAVRPRGISGNRWRAYLGAPNLDYFTRKWIRQRVSTANVGIWKIYADIFQQR